jgi:hypothetical protein
MTFGLLKSRLTKMDLAKKCFKEPSIDNNLKYKTYRNLYDNLFILANLGYFKLSY